jgi:ATP-dependent Lhr-like helicase
MQQDRDVVGGKLIKDQDTVLWCDRNNFAYLYRLAVASRRSAGRSVHRRQHLEFILHWHNISTAASSLNSIIERYQGVHFPLHFFEREILSTRMIDVPVESPSGYLSEMRRLIASGEVYVRVYTRLEGNDRPQLIFTQHGGGNLFTDYLFTDYPHPDKFAFDHPSSATVQKQTLSPNRPGKDSRILFNFLKENGASYFTDMESGTGLSHIQVQYALQQLTSAGLTSCDDYDSLLQIINSDRALTLPDEITASVDTSKSRSSYAKLRAPARSEIHHRVITKIRLNSGRWFLTSAFAVSGKTMSPEEKIEKQTRLLLNRHGILVKEWYRLENGLEPWYKIFQMLKKLEWQGEIRRGYFIEGLSGLQYALPQAVTLLEKIANKDLQPISAVILSTVDPALPFGRNIEWNIYDQKKEKIAVSRMTGNHLLFISGQPVVYTENYATRLFLLDGFNPDLLPVLVQHLKQWLLLPPDLRPRKRVEIEEINNAPAADHELAGEFIKLGFERDGKKLTLWPSRAQ